MADRRGPEVRGYAIAKTSPEVPPQKLDDVPWLRLTGLLDRFAVRVGWVGYDDG